MKEVNEDGHQEPIGAHEVIHGRPITSSTGTVTGRGSGEATLNVLEVTGGATTDVSGPAADGRRRRRSSPPR